MAALYIHIPFCKTKCHYCDFYRTTALSWIDDYVEALGREMEHRRDFLRGEPVETLFFGGGTPSLLQPGTLRRIIDRAHALWDLSGVRETTVEANPDDITETYLDGLTGAGINRLSFGIQSFIDRDLELMGRRHTADEAIRAIRTAQDKGFGNISIDLIFGIPGMSLGEWERNVLRAVSLGVQHISAYHLTINSDTVFGRMVASGRMHPIDDEDSEAQYLLCHRILSENGFSHYEISNYACDDSHRALHNSLYWDGTSYLGLGPSAHSYDGDRRCFAIGDLKAYIDGAGSDGIYECEILTETDKYNEFIMTALRTSRGVRAEELAARFGQAALHRFETASDKFLRTGLLRLHEGAYMIPPERMLISNSIISDLFYIED